METTGKLVNVSQDLLSGKMNLTFEVESSAISQLDNIKNEDKLSIKAVKFRAKRSLNANALLWECIGRMAAVLRSDKWDVYLMMLKRYGKFTYICVKENVVDAVKQQWRECEVIGEVTINGKKAIQMLCYFGSSTYDTQEMSILIDGVMSEMKEMGIETPTDERTKAALERWEAEWQSR